MKFATLFALVAVAAAEGDAAGGDKGKKEEPKKEEPANPCVPKTYKMYTDEKCTKADTAFDDAALKGVMDASKKLKSGECVEATKTKVTCEGGVKTELFKDDKCKTLDEEKMKTVTAEVKYGACTKVGEGKFVLATGAKALMASAAVALAFVGSQF